MKRSQPRFVASVAARAAAVASVAACAAAAPVFDYDAAMARGRDLRLAGDYPGALAAYQVLLDRDPGDVDARLGRGFAELGLGNLARAEADFGRVLTRAPGYADAFYGRALVAARRGDDAAARDLLRRGLALAPEYADMHLALARAARGLGDRAAARVAARDAAAHGADPAAVAALLKTLRRDPSGLPWEAALAYDRTGFDGSTRADWTTRGLLLKRRAGGATYLLDVRETRRFERDDLAVAAEAYLPVWPGGTLHLRAQATPDAQVLASREYAAELFDDLGRGWEGSLGYRHSSYARDDADILSWSLGRYAGEWYLRYRGMLIPTQGGNGAAAGVFARRYLGGDADWVEVGAGRGRDLVTLAGGPQIAKRATSFRALKARFFPWDTVGVELSYTAEKYQGIPDGRAWHVGLVRRW